LYLAHEKAGVPLFAIFVFLVFQHPEDWFVRLGLREPVHPTWYQQPRLDRARIAGNGNGRLILHILGA
jgi:hypothetical protein